MRTLDELKAMSDKQLQDLWGAAEFPFENLSCGTCMTGHHKLYGHKCDHNIMVERVTAITDVFDLWKMIVRENVEEFLALRLYHDDQYPPEKRVGSQITQQMKETVNG